MLFCTSYKLYSYHRMAYPTSKHSNALSMRKLVLPTKNRRPNTITPVEL